MPIITSTPFKVIPMNSAVQTLGFDTARWMTATPLDTTRFFVTTDQATIGGANVLQAIVVDISDPENISIGTEVNLHAAIVPRFPQSVLVDTDKVLTVYNNFTDSTKMTAVVSTISGSTITPGTPTVLDVTNFQEVNSLDYVDTNKAIVTTKNGFTGDAAARIVTVSGTTPTSHPKFDLTTTLTSTRTELIGPFSNGQWACFMKTTGGHRHRLIEIVGSPAVTVQGVAGNSTVLFSAELLEPYGAAKGAGDNGGYTSVATNVQELRLIPFTVTATTITTGTEIVVEDNPFGPVADFAIGQYGYFNKSGETQFLAWRNNLGGATGSHIRRLDVTLDGTNAPTLGTIEELLSPTPQLDKANTIFEPNSDNTNILGLWRDSSTDEVEGMVVIP